jgi:hypothetical protein
MASDSVIGKNHALSMLNIKSPPTPNRVNQINPLFPPGSSSTLGLAVRNKVNIKTNILNPIWIFTSGFIPKRIRKNKNRLLNAKVNRKAKASFSHLNAHSHPFRQMRKEAYHNKAKSIQIIKKVF